MFGLGFASVHSFPRGRNLRETAGLDSDPCTCSCENPMQGYLGCVYMQILVSSRQLSHRGQWTVQQICISIPNILFCHIYSNITCCILRTWRIITFGTVWYSKWIWRVTLYHFYWSVNSLFKQGTLVECQICSLGVELFSYRNCWTMWIQTLAITHCTSLKLFCLLLHS